MTKGNEDQKKETPLSQSAVEGMVMPVAKEIKSLKLEPDAQKLLDDAVAECARTQREAKVAFKIMKIIADKLAEEQQAKIEWIDLRNKKTVIRIK